MTHFHLRIHHDPTCAWCYIHHRKLLRAIALFQKTYPAAKSDTFQLDFVPFYRDRHAPAQGIPTWELMVQRNGEVQARGIKSRMDRIGRELGIGFKYRGKVGCTRDYQRIAMAVKLEAQQRAEGMEREFVEGVMRGFFEGEADVTDWEFLVGVAVEVGMEEERVRDVLRSGRFGAEVDEADDTARKEGVKAVPTTVINGVLIEGAEDVDVWYGVFVRIREGKGVLEGADGLEGNNCEEAKD